MKKIQFSPVGKKTAVKVAVTAGAAVGTAFGIRRLKERANRGSDVEQTVHKLYSHNTEEREEAASIIREIASEEPELLTEYVSGLSRSVHNQDESVSRSTSKALVKLASYDECAEDITNVLPSLLTSHDAYVNKNGWLIVDKLIETHPELLKRKTRDLPSPENGKQNKRAASKLTAYFAEFNVDITDDRFDNVLKHIYDSDEIVQRFAVIAAAGFVENRLEQISEEFEGFIRALKSDDSITRGNAAFVLGNILNHSPENSPAVFDPALDGIRSDDDEILENIFGMLSQTRTVDIPPEAAYSVDFILKTIQETDNKYVQEYASSFLKQVIRAYPEFGVPVSDRLAELLTHEEKIVRQNIATAIGFLEYSIDERMFEQTLTDLYTMTDDPTPSGRGSAFFAIRILADHSPSVTSKIEPQAKHSLNSTDPVERAWARQVIAHSQGKDPFKQRLDDEETQLDAIEEVEQLSRMTPEYATGYSDFVVELLDADDSDVRKSAARTVLYLVVSKHEEYGRELSTDITIQFTSETQELAQEILNNNELDNRLSLLEEY